jgi:hypothetical protein
VGRGPLISGREWRGALVVLLALLLVLAAVNPLLAMRYAPSRSVRTNPTRSLTGPAAAALGWPARTPHAERWPAPTHYTMDPQSGRTYYQVHGSGIGGRGAYQMQLWRWGLPLPVYEQVQMWWDWDDPALQGPEPDPPVRLVWTGVVLNPVIVGVPVWLSTVGVWLLWTTVKRARRALAGRCVFCGYPVGIGPVCTECGREGGAGKLMQPGAGLGHIAR